MRGRRKSSRIRKPEDDQKPSVVSNTTKQREEAILSAYKAGDILYKYGFLHSYLYPEKFPAAKYPDMLSLPTHACSLSTQLTFSSSSLPGVPIYILFNPLADIFNHNLLVRGDQTSPVLGAAPKTINTSSLQLSIEVGYGAFYEKDAILGGAWRPNWSMTLANKQPSLQYNNVAQGNTFNYYFQSNATLSSFSAVRLIGAYVSLEYVGNMTNIAGVVTQSVIQGRRALQNASFETFGSNAVETTSPLDYRQYLSRYRVADFSSMSFNITDMEATSGPFYVIVLTGVPANQQFFIKTIRHIEGVPVPSAKELVAPTPETGVASAAEQKNVINNHPASKEELTQIDAGSVAAGAVKEAGKSITEALVKKGSEILSESILTAATSRT